MANIAFTKNYTDHSNQQAAAPSACPKCKAEIPAAAKFCPDCGSPRG